MAAREPDFDFETPTRREATNSGKSMRRAIVQAALEQKDYYLHAWAAFSLYLIGWLPGLIFNVLVLRQARRHSRLLGRQIAGAGCLWILLLMNVVIPLVLILLAMSWTSVMSFLNTRAAGF